MYALLSAQMEGYKSKECVSIEMGGIQNARDTDKAHSSVCCDLFFIPQYFHFCCSGLTQFSLWLL